MICSYAYKPIFIQNNQFPFSTAAIVIAVKTEIEIKISHGRHIVVSHYINELLWNCIFFRGSVTIRL